MVLETFMGLSPTISGERGVFDGERLENDSNGAAPVRDERSPRFLRAGGGDRSVGGNP